MRGWMAGVVVLTASLGCGEKEPEVDDSAVEADADTDADTDTDTDADADTDSDSDTDLPDVSEGLDEEVCEESEGKEDWAGATTYFVGDFIRADGDWTGTETWLLFATSEWEAEGGGDCQVVWDMEGSEGSTGACGDCDYGLTLDATLNTDATTCPKPFWDGDESFTANYDLDEQSDGTVIWSFSSSGNPLGEGYWNEGGANYASPYSCKWF